MGDILKGRIPNKLVPLKHKVDGRWVDLGLGTISPIRDDAGNVQLRIFTRLDEPQYKISPYKELFTDKEIERLETDGHLGSTKKMKDFTSGRECECYVSVHEATNRLTTLPVDALTLPTRIYGKEIGDDIEALRIGMYNKVQEGPTYYSYIAFDLFGGELMTSTGRPIDLINSLSNALHTFVSSQWNGYYKALLQVNNVMSIAEGLADSPTRNRVLGECRYFRAYIYLCLVTRFGDVPVLRQNTQAKVSRDPASMAWELVEEDLDAASGFLNGLSADSFYYVSPAAVTALKARVKLYLGKKGEAKELAESLIANPNYALDDFDKIFRSKANKEVIFAFSCLTEDGSSIKISNQFYSYNHPNKGSYNYRPAGDVMTMYADNDLRKEVSITTLDNLNFVNKYPSGQTGSDPVVISRLAEMYLISAEAQGLNGGLDRLNELREKRGLDRVSPGNEADFLDAVLQERRLEFLAEGFRWYDLVRTGKATQTLGTKDYQCLMPLPSRELLYNPNLKPNNPGY